jgi:O-antigen ligase
MDYIKQENHYQTLLLDRIFIFVLLLNLTGLFVFIALRLKVNIVTVSLVLLGLNCLYITVNYKLALRIFRNKHIFYWSIFLLLWPLLATSYAPVINFRELGLQVYYFTLLLATIAYLLRNGSKSFHYIITAAFVVTIVGLILSMFTVNLFQTGSSNDQLNIRYQGRAFGFFMQPNLAAMSLNLLFVAWFAGLRKTRFLTMFLSTFGLLILVSLTGSRAGFISAAAIVFLIFVNRSIRTKKPFTILISPKSVITFFLVLGCFQASLPSILSFLKANLPNRVDNFDVINRIHAISEMNFSEKTSQGTSTVAKRLSAIDQYTPGIMEHPILGNGFGSITFLQAKGILGRSSHNQYLKIAFETGIFHLVFYLFILGLIYMDPKRKQIERAFHTNSYSQLLTVIILAGLVSNAVLNSRVLYCVLGCFIGMFILHRIIIDDNAPGENTHESERISSLRTVNES